MYCVLTIARYPRQKAFFGLLSMALFRWPLRRNKAITFYKLMGCGRGGTFDKTPDWQQWAVLAVLPQRPAADTRQVYGSFIHNWWKRHHCELFTLVLQPLQGHGLWDGLQPFGNLPRQAVHTGLTAVLTRATIRLNKLNAFWKNVNPAAAPLQQARGFIMSVGIGEVPWVKQATFSIWAQPEDIHQYAYANKQHAAVIGKTRKENWYSEELFVRFAVLEYAGTIRQADPLASGAIS